MFVIELRRQAVTIVYVDLGSIGPTAWVRSNLANDEFFCSQPMVSLWMGKGNVSFFILANVLLAQNLCILVVSGDLSFTASNFM